jgi:hypothetical protein
VRTRAGRRFVDAPEVRRISTTVVTLGIANSDVTEADWDAVIASLKRAFVRDELTVDELGQRVEAVHASQTLDQLAAALEGLTLA